jgi:hypothetical protein
MSSIQLRSFCAATASTLAVLAASTATAQADRRTVSGSSIAIYDIAGRVQVEPGTGSEVVVEVTRGGRDSRRLSVEVGEIRGRNTLRVIFPDGDIVYPELGRWSNSDLSVNSDGTWGGDRGDRSWFRGHRIRVSGGGRGVEAWADLRILVPAGKRVDVNLGVGEMDATRVDADLHLDASSGRIHATNTKGNLTIDTGSGGIEVRGATGESLMLDTGSGGISAWDITSKRCKLDTGSGGVRGGGLDCDDLTIDTGSGSIGVDGVKASRIKLDAGSGGINVSLTSSPRSLDVDAGSGGVTISLPSAVSAEVEIETGSGGIDSDFPIQVTRMERNHLRGTLGKGEGRIRIESGSGRVHLRKN